MPFIRFNRTFMELKSHGIVIDEKAKTWFNRTFMELKSFLFLPVFLTLLWFNRTFMELKSTYGTQRTAAALGLIVPLWN